MIRIRQMKLPVSHSEEDLRRKISRLLRCGGTPFSFEIIRQSLDARHKDDKKFVYTVDVTIEGEQKILKKVNDNNIMLTSGEEYHFPSHGEEPLRERPVIAGAGPAGLICAWYLAREGYHPILLERGDPADIRLHRT